MYEVLRLMSEAPGRELLITAATGAYIYGPFNSFVAGPFETEDFKTLVDDGVLIESGRRQNTFVFNPQPPDFSNLNLGGPDHISVGPAVRCGMAEIYTPKELAEILENVGHKGVCCTPDTETLQFFSQTFSNKGDQANG